jgi:hypothetical protein
LGLKLVRPFGQQSRNITPPLKMVRNPHVPGLPIPDEVVAALNRNITPSADDLASSTATDVAR